MATTEPQKWSATLGANADVNSLPATTPAGSGRASTSGLFPQITQKPLDEGGIAPERADFNALFKYLGDYIYYVMQGGVFSYLSTYAYTAGNLATFSGAVYECIAANGPDNMHAPTDTAYWRKLATLQDIPPAAVVNDGQLTINVNNTQVATFTANQAGNSTANITIPAAPTVGDGQLTINVDGSPVAMFTANQTGNATANITISEIDSQGAGWVRFKNGFQICGKIEASWGYFTVINFPRAFTSVWSVTVTNMGVDTYGPVVYAKVGAVGTSSFNLHSSISDVGASWYWMAIGTWK